MYTKGESIFKVLFLATCIGLAGCSGSEDLVVKRANKMSKSAGGLALPEQKPAASNIKSIVFTRTGTPPEAPVIRLNSSEKLTLSFDALTNQSEQYRLEITHHGKDWQPSSLPPEWFIDGFQQFFITGGKRSTSGDPRYFHYSVTFPNNQFSIKISGNYLVHVYDAATGEELFSLPFFVSENVGEITTDVQTLFNAGTNGRPVHQLFSRYKFPKLVQFPQFDLSFAYTQNRFWGNTRIPENFDTSKPDEVEFHLSREQSFPADFEFNQLDLSTLGQRGIRILDWQPEFIPPRIILHEDVQNFSATPLPSRRVWEIDNQSSARYADVFFSFSPRLSYSPDTRIYLLGDFNQWQISEPYRLTYDPATTWWKTNQILKQGFYFYKYVLVENGELSELTLDDGYVKTTQEYTAFVYFFDPTLRYHRLLMAQTVVADKLF